MSQHDEYRRTSDPFMLRERELATRWDVSQRTLQRWRSTRRGPPWVMIEGTVRYPIEEILAFERAAKHGGCNW